MADPITTIGLCAGVGWLDESVAAGCRYFGREHRVAAYCEWEAYAANCLLARMEESSLEPAPVWGGDLGQFNGKAFRGSVDGIVAGFPCQPWSAAGKQLGTEDDRWLWPAIVRVIGDVEPGFVFLENVSALIAGGGLEHVLSDLAKMGFDAEWCCLTAEAVGAAHRRERVFILAYDPGARGRGLPEPKERTAGRDADWSGGGLLDDSGGDGAGEPWKPGEERPVDPHGRGIESGGRCSALADAVGSGTPQSQAGGRRRATTAPAVAGAAVAVARRNGRRVGQPRGRSRGRAAAGGSGGAIRGDGLAIATGQGPQRERQHDGASGREVAIGSTGLCSGELFAPGPSADWSGIPEALWPATERGFRLLVDGRPVVLDEGRADQLRCGGNGVVALQGAVAFVELVRRAMKMYAVLP